MKKQHFLCQEGRKDAQQYWSKELVQPLPRLDIPKDFLHYSIEDNNKRNIEFFFDGNLQHDLKNTLIEVDMQTFTLAAYFAWVGRLSNEKDILIGVDSHNTILPIRISIESIQTFEELMEVVREKLRNASKYPFIKEEMMLNENDEALVQTVFSTKRNKVLQNEVMLHWQVIEQENKVMLNIEYDTQVFEAKTIKRFIEYYVKILKAVLKNPQSSIYSIDILTEKEQQIYQHLNNTQMDFDNHKSIPKMFEEAVCAFADHIAISSDKEQLTYRQLNNRANQLANGLIQKGLRKGEFVTIFMNRSIETIVSIMGILKAGGVYISIDPKHPEERNQYIIDDAKSTFIITKSIYINKAKELLSMGTSVKEVLLIESDINAFSTENPNEDIKPEDIAYVIYTSGSTGTPKGTLIAHRGVVNLGCLIRNEFNINENEILTQFSTYSFDASVWDTFGSLFWGARLHLLSEEERISVDAFADVIHRIKATFITILPTVFFNQVATYLSEEDAKKLATVKKVAVGGEALTGEIVRAFQRKFQNSIEVINLYGPTESTVVATGHRVTNLVPEHQVNIPIGKPFSNYAVYIVNEENQLCPINVPGEIYISSLALAKGYLNQEAKTKEVFIDNPFKTNSVIYKSGDIGRILEDGVIEYVGRKDSQVKVRGHRIEIGEIEDSLAKYPQIQDVVIIPKKDHGNGTILVGYYTSKNDQKIKTTKLKEFLLEKLPSYMVPQYINQLEEMPISPTGKVDRKKLATFEVLQTEKNEHYVAPKNEIQQIIAYTWKQVLNLEQVSTDDDFFEIGGDSIKIMSVLVLLKPYFPQLKISDFFTHKTIEELAIRVKEVKREDQNAYKNKEQGAWEIKDMNEYPAGINNHRQLYTYKNPKNILLTGSTGYLGSHILYELMQSTNAKVYCLLRKTTHKTIKEKLVNTMQGYFGKEIIRMINERVVFIEGDLEKDQLGLGLCDQKMIKENIDTIIHAAADVRHFGDSTHFEKVNIQGTKHILDIAKSKQDIRFHYVSTLGIPEDLSLSGKWEEVISKPKFDENLKLENVYTNSKLAAEKLVYQAGEEGIAINVYRAGNLTCRSDNGYFQKNIDSNAFYRMIKAMLLLGKAPKANCYLDFTPIDYASKVIVDLIYQQNSIGETFHICNPEQILYSSMIDMICEFGYDVELIDQIEYEEYLFDENQYKNPEGIELAIAQLDGDGVKDSCYRFSCSNTKKYLDPAYFQYTQIDQNFIDNMLKYGIEAGYFPTREYCVARNKQGEKVG